MRKVFTFIAAMLVAFAVNADPVVLPATLDVSNVSFRSEGMPDFVLADGDYAGTYFDMGAHDSSNDTLLYAEWDVTIESVKYLVSVDVYNTNSWSVQLYVLNQAGDTLKSLRYAGSSGEKGQFSIGTLNLTDLAAGNYKVLIHAATPWSAMKLKDVIFAVDYQGVPVALPDTLLPPYAELSANASLSNGAIAFKPSTANQEYATWNVSFATAGDYNVTLDMTASNGHNYGVALLSADGQTEIDALTEGGQKSSTGVKKLGTISVPAAGNYKVKLTNATKWSEAVINSIAIDEVYTVVGDAALCGSHWNTGDVNNDMNFESGSFNWSSGPVYYDGDATWGFKIVPRHDSNYVGAYPNDNYEISSSWKLDGGAGYYNVEIAYVNEGNNRITVTATYLYPAKVNLAMFSNDWNFIEMEWNNENTVCSVSRNLELGQVPDSFKIVVTQGASTAWYGNNGQMNRVYYENWTFATTEPNCRLLVDVPGQYNFAFTLASKNVTVAYPTSFTREAATTNYQTLCVPFDAEKPAGVTIYEVTNVSASSVTIEVPDLAYLVAGKSYIIKPEAAGNIVITKKAEGNSVAAPINTFMYGILGVDYQPTADLGAYVLSGNQFHLVAEDGAATVSSTRAYVKAVDASAAPALRIVEGGNDATNIENLGADETAVKFIQNGQLYIKRNGVVYSATGAVVK